MLENNHPSLSIRRQCELLNLNRSNVYYKNCAKTDDDMEVCNQIHEIYTHSGCRYGYRKITAGLFRNGYQANHKRVLRLMRSMNIQGLYPKPRTSIRNKEHEIYPYLLRDLSIVRPNQVWATDITYIPMPLGFIYLVAILDWHSRYIVNYKISNSLEAIFCIEMLEEALENGIKPEIFNSDQGSQFTSLGFTEILKSHQIQISMDGKGRCFDNIRVERLWRTIKQEDMYFHGYENVKDAREHLKEFINYYNNERLHQSLDYQTPSEVYFEDKEKENYINGHSIETIKNNSLFLPEAGRCVAIA